VGSESYQVAEHYLIWNLGRFLVWVFVVSWIGSWSRAGAAAG